MQQPRSPQSAQVDRACDYCRRRKAKCDSSDLSCTNCRKVGQSCTFLEPLRKRGPKRRRQSGSIDTSPINDREFGPSSPSIAALTFVGVEQPPIPSPASIVLHPSLSQSPAYPIGPAQRWTDLLAAIAAAIPSKDPQIIVRDCVDLFFEYLHSSTYLVDEAGVRDSMNHIATFSQAHPSLTVHKFTLITAICAKTSFFCPPSLFSEGQHLAEIFLATSRDCLNSYREEDLENPNADSITIRYLHSNSLHTSARGKISFHVFGEAIRIIQGMGLHDESSYEGIPFAEAESRRKSFWQVFMGDKSLSVLTNKPMSMHQYSYEKGITVAYPSQEHDESVIGFNACVRLWQASSDILLGIRLIKERETRSEMSQHQLSEADRTEMKRLHIRFATCLDDLPFHLRAEGLPSSGELSSKQRRSAIQVADLTVTKLCMTLFVGEKLEEIGYFHGHDEWMLTLRKTEIAQDLVTFVQTIPFWSLQINGEPFVEKLRVVGATLLAIMNHDEFDFQPLVSRARRDFDVLLDILARLDSKASNALLHDLTF